MFDINEIKECFKEFRKNFIQKEVSKIITSIEINQIIDNTINHYIYKNDLFYIKDIEAIKYFLEENENYIVTISYKPVKLFILF